MARKKLCEEQIRAAQANILSGSTFELEAHRLEISVSTMKAAIISLYKENGGNKNAFFKKVQSASRKNAEKLRKAGTPIPAQSTENDPMAVEQRKSAAKKRARASEVVVDEASAVPTQTDNTMTDDARLATIIAKCNAIDQTIATLGTELAAAQTYTSECEGPVSVAKEAIRQAQKALNEAENALQNAKSEEARIRAAINNEKKKKSELEREAQEIKEKYIYLVAPGYDGDFPVCGTYVSTEMVNNRVMVKKPSTEYNPNVPEMIEAGYDSLKEYQSALAFASLVSWYKELKKSFTILLGSDSKLQKLLELHGLMSE